jgi:hypothetical protein
MLSYARGPAAQLLELTIDQAFRATVARPELYDWSGRAHEV